MLTEIRVYQWKRAASKHHLAKKTVVYPVYGAYGAIDNNILEKEAPRKNRFQPCKASSNMLMPSLRRLAFTLIVEKCLASSTKKPDISRCPKNYPFISCSLHKAEESEIAPQTAKAKIYRSERSNDKAEKFAKSELRE